MLPADNSGKITCKGCDDMQYFGLTDVGSVRENNEDCFGIRQISDHAVAFVVADGMGGHLGGEEASSFAVDFVLKAIDEASSKLNKYSDKQIENLLKNTVIKVNKALFEKANDNTDLAGMGTTLVVCIVIKGKYYVSNVGDSRLYIHSSSLTQITKDHSYVSELVDMGAITKEQALTHPGKNVITRAVGTEEDVLPDIFKGKLKHEDVILICTDGLTNMVSDSDIADIVSKGAEPQNMTDNLVRLAKQNGGKDNVTVVTVKSENGGDKWQ